MKKVFLVTNSFPFMVGEQFIEGEMPFWNEIENCELEIIPFKHDNNQRDIGKAKANLSVSNFMKKNKWSLFFFLKTLLSKEFIGELLSKPTLFFKPKSFYNLIRFIYFGLIFEKAFEENYKDSFDGKSIFYTYWFSFASFGLSRLKLKGYKFKLITRAHRVDLYDYSQVNSYMPLCKKYHENIDEIHSISSDGKRHLIEKYSIPASKVFVSKLGVKKPRKVTFDTRSASEVHFLSVSYVKPVKQVFRIADEINTYSKENPNLKVYWTHFGGGQEFIALKEYISKFTFNIDLKGQVSNEDLLFTLSENSYDIFVNLSKSEGVPVSIMEAMSYGLPVIATDVGGTSEAVTLDTGRMVSLDFTSEEFCMKVNECLLLDRERIIGKYNSEFSDSVNYKQFINGLLG